MNLTIKVVQPKAMAAPSWSLRGNAENCDLLLKLVVNNQEELSVLIDNFAKHKLPMFNYTARISQCPIGWQGGVWHRKLTLVLQPMQQMQQIQQIQSMPQMQPMQPMQQIQLPPIIAPVAPIQLPSFNPDQSTRQLIELAKTRVTQNKMSLPDFSIRFGKNQVKILNYLKSSLAYPELTMAQAMVIAEHLAR
jgi:hypothetical protein